MAPMQKKKLDEEEVIVCHDRLLEEIFAKNLFWSTHPGSFKAPHKL